MNSYNLNCFDEMAVNNNRLPVTQMDCTLQNVPKKRRLDENSDADTTVFPIGYGKRFIPVRRNCSIYMTEDWKLTGSSLFKPVMQDLFVNTDKYDQLSVIEGNFFVADDMGKYCKSVTGKVLHLWRYDKTEKQLFVALSLLYTCPQVYRLKLKREVLITDTFPHKYIVDVMTDFRQQQRQQIDALIKYFGHKCIFTISYVPLTSYLDLLLSVSNGTLFTELYDKRDDFDFRIVNFPFISSNIPGSPAYGVYISQLIRYARACSLYSDFVSRSKSLTAKLVEQGYTKDKLKVYGRRFYDRYTELILT